MLVNVPLRNQLSEPTTDNGPDEAARANCVPASLGAAVSALTGQTIYGDALRDLVYPESYTGATNPVDYIPVLRAHFGIEMVEFDSGDGNALIQHAIAALEAHQPVSAAIPSEWGLDYIGQDMVHFAGGTHEVTFCDYDSATGVLTAMNPWPEPPTNDAFYQSQPAAWWAERLVYGRVFVLTGGNPMAWIKQPDGSARDDGTGIVLHLGMAAYVLDNNVSQHGLMGETYYTGEDSFVPCTGGLILSYNKAENRVRADKGGETLVAIWQQLVAAKAAGGDPAGQAALAEVAAIKKVLGVA